MNDYSEAHYTEAREVQAMGSLCSGPVCHSSPTLIHVSMCECVCVCVCVCVCERERERERVCVCVCM